MKKHSDNTSQPALKARILHSLLIASTVILLFYLLFEVADLFWLTDLDMEMLHLVYVIRGIFISLIAVILVGWLVLRSSQPLLSSEQWVEGERSTNEKRIRRFNHWFIVMRWIAIVVASILIFIVVRINKWLPEQVWWPLVFCIATLTLLNIVYQSLVYKGRYHQKLLPFQAYADLVVLIILLHYSGGIENPLTLMMLIHVFIAGIVLSRRHLYAVTTTAIFLLIIMAVGEATGMLDHYTLNIFPHFEGQTEHSHAAHMPLYVISHVGLMVTIFLLSAYFIGTIMNRIRHDEQQLEILADRSLEQRQLIEKALETSGTGLCVLNNDGFHHLSNQLWTQWFGRYTPKKLTENAEYNSLQKTLSDGTTRNIEIKQKSNSDKSDNRIFRIITAPLLDKDGKFDHAVALASDITEEKRAQEQILRAGKLAAVGELAGKVAHEVNNPIGIISAKCRLMLSDETIVLPEKVRTELTKITDASDRVSDIAKGLLSYCRPSAAERKAMELHIPINNALHMISQTAENAGISIKKNIADPLPLVLINTHEMQQVFLNIFLNALDAMPEGGMLSISVDTPAVSDSHLHVIIQDNGEGIPEHVQQQIFEPFVTTKEEGKGTGLGLSICMGLMRSHNGTMDITSELGKGTKVTLSLPIANHHKEDITNG